MYNSKYISIFLLFFLLCIKCILAQIPDGEIKGLVDEYLNRNSDNTVKYIMEIYGDNVEYYNKGFVDQNFITKDKTDYFNKWPYRQYSLISEIQIANGNNKNEKIAEFNYSYSVSNDSRHLEGEAWCRLLIVNNEGLKIMSEKGGLLKSNTNAGQFKKTINEIDGVKLSVISVEDPTEPSVFYRSSFDSKLIGINVQLENNSKTSINFKITNFSLEDSDGNIYQPLLGSAKKQIKDCELKKGQKINGMIPFKIHSTSSISFLNFKLKSSGKNLRITVQ